ncbi:protein of unknown function DUF820 [Gloeothece citriformis PCC 7424]|uniref:Putative restriction endonuclease domain-containing protein n=1 Tax=Gloeothece citriformis (strain PCC 7424) TaxID=65393 RepID=B7K942_GLOC7|nr:Uma2 family endonuclease [Gloeothece citriformis]ACK72811.1 protein of unknown function DUF820 [Gloeothece citriformis PCC 7424]
MTPTAINLPLEAGQNITLSPVSWSRFEQVLAELPQRRLSRLAYANKILEIMTPLPEHERAKIVLADLVKTLLRLQKRPWEALGSTTFKRQEMAVGVEPDECFYIQNYQAVIGKDTLDLNSDPPPDLAIEIDVTSITKQAAYLTLKVPELWIYTQGKLTIYIFQEDQYQLSNNSLIFAGIPIIELIERFMKRAKIVGVSQMLLEFEEYVNNLLLKK